MAQPTPHLCNAYPQDHMRLLCLALSFQPPIHPSPVLLDADDICSVSSGPLPLHVPEASRGPRAHFAGTRARVDPESWPSHSESPAFGVGVSRLVGVFLHFCSPSKLILASRARGWRRRRHGTGALAGCAGDLAGGTEVAGRASRVAWRSDLV